jgi:hypothetical protein
MYIKLDKINENDKWVSYLFSTNIPDTEYINGKGKKRFTLKTVNGVFNFNKITEQFELGNDSDLYYKKDSREVIKIFFALLTIKRDGVPFPNILDIATG